MEIVGDWLRGIILPTAGLALLAVALAALRTWAASCNDERLRRFIEELVRAAEQIFGAEAGDEKLAWVEAQAKENGLDAPRPMIEAAVLDLTLAQRTLIFDP
ncbi:MAG TPA: hypothetical protein VM283_06450 [Armatimonadota bacterium]|nr:hypothetical protein [Armatimonadota bacterium]